MPKNVYSILQLWYCSDSCFIFCKMRPPVLPTSKTQPKNPWNNLGCSALKIWANNLITPKNQGVVASHIQKKIWDVPTVTNPRLRYQFLSIASPTQNKTEMGAASCRCMEMETDQSLGKVWLFFPESHDSNSLKHVVFFFVFCVWLCVSFSPGASILPCNPTVYIPMSGAKKPDRPPQFAGAFQGNLGDHVMNPVFYLCFSTISNCIIFVGNICINYPFEIWKNIIIYICKRIHIDTRNSHIWNKIQVPSHHFRYLC